MAVSSRVKAEEQQRIFGFIPNFYVEYDPNVAPLTTKLKFQLAAKVSYDPVTLAGVGLFAAANQAGDRPNYTEGAKGYAERYGAVYADGITDIMIGGAVLPSLLHQDRRYFYQGSGSSKSRAFHALRSSFVCKGDNGRWQPNYSTVGGDVASAALSNAYYPASNRGVGLFLSNFFIDTGQRAAANLAQEFILHRVTRVKNQKWALRGSVVGQSFNWRKSCGIDDREPERGFPSGLIVLGKRVWRTLSWLVARWGLRGRRLSRAPGNLCRQRVPGHAPHRQALPARV